MSIFMFMNDDYSFNPRLEGVRKNSEQSCAACGAYFEHDDMYPFGDTEVCGDCSEALEDAMSCVDHLDDDLKPLFFSELKHVYSCELGISRKPRARVYICVCCGQDIFEGDRYFEVMGEQICPKCILNHIETAKRRVPDGDC